MANNNVQNVKFLRNGSVFTPSGNQTAREVALENMNSQLANLADGSAILGRYQEAGGTVKTLVGFAYVSGETKTLTVFDVEGANADVDTLRTEINSKLGTGITSANTATAQLIALSGNGQSTSAETSVEGAKRYADDLISTLDVTDNAVEGSYVSQVSEADGKISVSRVALPSASTVSGESKVVIDVTQNKGAITATASNLTGVKLAGYAEGTDEDIAATDTLGEALGKLQAQINAMDKTADVVAGQVVTTVTEVDGKVTETKANVKDLQLGGYAKTNDTGDIASADTVNVALSKLENKIGANAISNDDHSIVVTPQTNDDTDIKVNIKSGEKVMLLDSNGIYTDLDLVKITTGLPETVKERYQFLASDDTQIGDNIDIPKDSHIVSINYITTGEHAQNLEYVYIDVSGNTQTTYVDMSELVLETEFGSGVTVTNHVAHGVVDPTSESFFTVGANGFKVAGISAHVQTEIEKLDASVSGGTTAGDATSNHIQVIVDEADGKLTAVTLTETNIADKSALDELSGKTITAITSTNNSITASIDDAVGNKSYNIETDASKIKMSGFTSSNGALSGITTADSIATAFEKTDAVITENERVIASALTDLDGRLDVIESGYVETVKVNNVALAETNNAVNVQISAAAGTGAQNAAIEVNTDNSTGAVTISLLGLDCGTY